MSQVLPPVRTVGEAGSVGLSVAAAFGRRDAAPARPAPRSAPVVEDDGDGGAEWDPAVLATPRARPAPRQLPNLTLAEVWAAQDIRARQARSDDVGEDLTDWSPEDDPRFQRVQEAAPAPSGAALAAGALSRMFGGLR